jgi:hypothetical protein
VRYCGVLAPHARGRPAVLATAGPGGALAAQLRAAALRMELAAGAAAPADAWPPQTRAERLTWALLLARIDDVLPLLW